MAKTCTSESTITCVDYSRAQTLALQYIVYLSAPWSIAGSALIIWVILNERQSIRKSVYHRLMLGMSVLDLCNSVGILAFGPWAMPQDTVYDDSMLIHARGNFTTCEVAGFFVNLVFGTVFYSGFLALYFLLLIRFDIREEWIARYIEPIGHVLAIGWPLASGGVAIYVEAFNPMSILPGWCWIVEYPLGCDEEDNVECIRGHDKITPPMYFLAAGPLMLAAVFAVIVVSMVLIFLKVRDTEKRLERYAGTSNQSYERTKEVGRQALLYIAAFLFTYFPIAGTMTTKQSKTGLMFFFGFLVKALSTMQGLFNAIIFLRNQYRALTAQGHSLYFLRRLAFLASFRPTPESQAMAASAVDHDTSGPMTSGVVPVIVSHQSDASRKVKSSTAATSSKTLQTFETNGTHEETERMDEDRVSESSGGR